VSTRKLAYTLSSPMVVPPPSYLPQIALQAVSILPQDRQAIDPENIPKMMRLRYGQ
ncbi:uncharacterized protein METZ01_LOCUS333243, partial [marine metagenome]